MKEFEGRVVKLGVGLRPDKNNSLQEPFLVECHNLEPQGEGLEPYEPLTQYPGVIAETMDWPFPQLFRGSVHTLLGTRTQLYSLSASWTKTLIADVEVGQLPWEVLDFDDFIVATNGATLVFNDPISGVWSMEEGTETVPMFSTGCNFRGQAVVGNLTPEWYGGGVGSVAWSSIGSFNFVIGKNNVAGVRKLPWEGQLLHVKPLKDCVVVYHENGVGILFPVDSTFGFRPLLDVGIASKGAVTGNEDQHVFVDAAGYLWTIQNQVNPERYEIKKQRLGYKEFLTQLTASDIRMSFDPYRKRYYITDGTGCYCLAPGGLFSTYQMPTNLTVVSGESCGVLVENDDVGASLITDSIDMQLRALKVIESFELGVSAESDLQVSVLYRYGYKEAFKQSTWKPVNNLGIGSVKVAANEFRACIKSNSFANLYLDYINYRAKLIDKRNIRGAYGSSQVTTGASGV